MSENTRTVNCFDLLTLPDGAVFTLDDGEGSDGCLYVKSGDADDDILVERLTEPGESARLGIREMEDWRRRSTLYRILSQSDLVSMANWLLDLAMPIVVAKVPS